MKEELNKKLINKYPLLYKKLRWFECGDGWFNLLDALSANIEKEIEQMEQDIQGLCIAVQVKEKFGALRFYMGCTTDRIEELITVAERESAITCECCGKLGKIRDSSGWLSVLCDECNDQKNKRENNGTVTRESLG